MEGGLFYGALAVIILISLAAGLGHVSWQTAGLTSALSTIPLLIYRTIARSKEE